MDDEVFEQTEDDVMHNNTTMQQSHDETIKKAVDNNTINTNKYVQPSELNNITPSSPIKCQNHMHQPIINLRSNDLNNRQLNHMTSLSDSINIRRQSLPCDQSDSLRVPIGSLSSSFTRGGAGHLGDEFHRFSGTCTPLMTPAISVSSLVSSLEGSMDDLTIDDQRDEASKRRRNKKEDYELPAEQFAYLQDKDIIDSRLQRYFKALQNDQYIEEHEGRTFEPSDFIDRCKSNCDLSDTLP